MDYALAAEVMCVRRPGAQDWSAPAGLTFRDWLRGAGERPPTSSDLSYHLSTLFPPVRPRGHLEVRGIDAQPGDGWMVPLAVTAALHAAYDDAAGVTAAFNKNVLAVLNARLGANFDLAAFDHVALWDPRREWIEMRLRSDLRQAVTLPEIGLTVEFAEGEEMRTEVSAKFRRDGVAAELSAAGFTMLRWWTDSGGQFGLSQSVPA